MAPTADGTAPASKDPGNGDAPSAPTTFYRRRPPPGEERAKALSHTMRFPDGDGAAEITLAYQPPPGDTSGLAGTSRERPDAGLVRLLSALPVRANPLTRPSQPCATLPPKPCSEATSYPSSPRRRQLPSSSPATSWAPGSLPTRRRSS